MQSEALRRITTVSRTCSVIAERIHAVSESQTT